MTQQELPIDAHVPSILRTLREGRHAVIVAPPGSGKTTRVPPALLCFGRVILLQPRRVAARSSCSSHRASWPMGGSRR